ncbi:hypothetical protein P9250_04825 [Caballeronia sp. LP006]|jgi:hypothetical protein|uniref:hypothetical protein n=1 Tax=unclassified Caballeronia TaxID=2646786 RepID=UPI001FD066BF|nr:MULTISPECIES: hypothetical protein [unclassified Caballeronia]MDR5774796.1 hypothetical protein [Caballeronia sp. LZ002]MDR5827185.1 hypothetical protein [Caballeronia sp. LP006]MDR5850232.1 hypothetical protein [Caballeronia sp. LZ003]
MEPNISVSIDEKGQPVITHGMPLADYCVQRAQTLRAMVQVVCGAKRPGEDAGVVSAALIKPLMQLIRTQVDELEPLFRALDQRAYEKGFDDGKEVGYPRRALVELDKQKV